MLSKKWNAINTELHFIQDLLNSGATQIRQASFIRRGLYFQAFSNLSIGLERVGKICGIVDYALLHKGKYPSKNYGKEIGHDLIALYQNSKKIIKNHNLSLTHLPDLDSLVYQNILTCLNRFAKGDRYHNIDLVLSDADKMSPVALWHHSVDNLLWKEKVSKAKKQRILANASFMDKLFGKTSMVRHLSDADIPLESVLSASEARGYADAVGSHRQLAVLQIIRYWREILSELDDQNMKSHIADVPSLGDYLVPYFNDDKYLRSRMTWDTFP